VQSVMARYAEDGEWYLATVARVATTMRYEGFEDAEPERCRRAASRSPTFRPSASPPPSRSTSGA
jgi:hypothetical protein